MVLLGVDPLAVDNMLARRERHDVPSMILEQGLHLFVHRHLLMRRSDSIDKAAWYRIRIDARKKQLVGRTQPLEGQVVRKRIEGSAGALLNPFLKGDGQWAIPNHYCHH